jgi:hypothetical protein
MLKHFLLFISQAFHSYIKFVLKITAIKAKANYLSAYIDNWELVDFELFSSMRSMINLLKQTPPPPSSFVALGLLSPVTDIK